MRKLNSRVSLLSLFSAAALLLPESLHAATITLDWNTLTWTPGALSQSFDVDPANPGNDVTISITGDTNRFATPINTTTLITGGISPTNKTLELVVNPVTNLESIRVIIDFLYASGVTDLSYFIHDIDGAGGTWIEQVRNISGTGDTLPNFPPSSIEVVSASPTFQIAGSGLALTATATSEGDDATNRGSLGVAFGPQTVRTASFDYGSSTAGAFDPIASGIGLGTISFTPNPVPEPTSGLLLLSAVSFAGFRRARKSLVR